MKKLFFLALSCMLIITACNNGAKPATETAKTDTTAVTAPAPTATAPTGTDGTPTTPAQVFDESTLKSVPGATITAVDADRATAETVKTDDKGAYAFTKLTAGKTYTFTATKTGYTTQSVDKSYESNSTLPGFALKAK